MMWSVSICLFLSVFLFVEGCPLAEVNMCHVGQNFSRKFFEFDTLGSFQIIGSCQSGNQQLCTYLDSVCNHLIRCRRKHADCFRGLLPDIEIGGMSQLWWTNFEIRPFCPEQK
jgi:hypothetical protein